MVPVRQWLLVIIAVFVAACDSGHSPMTLPPDRVPPAAPRLSITATDTYGISYPIHWYGDETDNWGYITPSVPAYVEIMADNQTPQP